MLLHRIQQFSAMGDFIRTWGNKGTENGQFKYPHDVVVNTNGDIYVTDVGNKRIQQFGSAGNFIRSWRVNLPKKIAISPDGSIYVFHFSSPGSQVSHFSLSGVVIPSLNEKDLPLSLRLEEDDIGGFSGSVDDIAIAPDGSIYIADSSNDRILKVIPEK